MAQAKVKSNEVGSVTYISQDSKDDFKVIKLKENGQLYVEHNILADNLINRGLAEEVKKADFDLESKTIRKISDVKDN